MYDEENEMPEPVDTVVEKLKRELYRWSELLSFDEIKTNSNLIHAIERLEEVFGEEYGVRFRD